LFKDSAIAWFCTYTPLEILDAAGLIPLRHFGDPQILESADTLLHPAICPYARACLADELVKEGPHHAVFVNSCDAMRRLYDVWRESFPHAFVYLMDLPRNAGSTGQSLLVQEYRHLMDALRESWGVEITLKDLREANRAREEWRLYYLAHAEGASGEERLRMAMQAHSRSLEELDLSSEGIRRGNHGATGIPVLLTGNLLNPSGLVSSLDRAGARVMWLDLCNGDRSFSTSTLAEGDNLDSLLASMAVGYLSRHPCARMSDPERRYRLMVSKARESEARGIIYTSLKFCDSYLYDYPGVQDTLKRQGIPVLRLESDYTDGNVGQVLTRVEAFLEMI
jgi:benzoyl-CoA reductase/2-hydroxyglutaryl-CoA dehydratase subunit BcrC/BadD/HgdB